MKLDLKKAQSGTYDEGVKLDLDDHKQSFSEELNNNQEKFVQAQ